MRNVGVFNTSIGSSNIGDHIIMEAVLKEVSPLLNTCQQIHFSSHDAHLYNSLKLQRRVEYNVLCGTNCLSSKMWYRPSWAINLLSAGLLKPTVTLGVGWGAYQGKPDVYTKLLLRKVLASDTLLSVRDEYTKQQLEIAGFDNVINTACLTMWGLTSEWCEGIVRNRASKAGAVVYTLTDYAIDYDLDFYSIKLLLDSYDEVYIWMQGSRDWSCFQEIVRRESAFFSKHKHAIKIVPPVLSCYDRLLESGCVDYVGTRLHGGIRALQKGVRTIIIGVDNRALEKKRDFKLPVVKRSEVESLREVIDSEYALEIELPLKNIERFKNSFGEFCQRHCTGSEFYIYR